MELSSTEQWLLGWLFAGLGTFVGIVAAGARLWVKVRERFILTDARMSRIENSIIQLQSPKEVSKLAALVPSLQSLHNRMESALRRIEDRERELMR